MEHLIGKPIELVERAHRVFGGCEQGIIRSVFKFKQLVNPDLVWYADIDWFDKSYSSFPVSKIRSLTMNGIWKFPVKIGRTSISVPRTHRFIHAGFVTEGAETDFAVWAEVDHISPSINVEIVVYPTGNCNNVNPDWQYINSFRTNRNNVPEFWHVYKALPKRNPEDCSVATTKESA